MFLGGERMIIVYKDNKPVACYEGVSHFDALISYADEICKRPHTAEQFNILSAYAVECQCKKCRAVSFAESS
jgi:hypothetical protein